MKKYITTAALGIFVLFLTSGCIVIKESEEIQKPIIEVPEDTTVETTDETTDILLYYYNYETDKEIADYIPCSADAILPLPRTVPKTDTLIKDTINLLLKGQLTEEEIADGFQTEFPHLTFKLLSTNLENGVLTLEFDDPDSFTIGGSCRVGILLVQIKKTALQFEEVQEVIIEPDTLFQP